MGRKSETIIGNKKIGNKNKQRSVEPFMCLDVTVGRREISFKINTHSTTSVILGQDKEKNVKQLLKKEKRRQTEQSPGAV